MDEFRHSRQTPLITFGVSTCTAIVISLPGELAYLGHASIHDQIYGDGDLDLLGHMLRRLRRFEIYPYQLRHLQVVLVAPHGKSVDRAVTRLAEAGLLLSQIRFLYRPDAESANVYHLPTTGRTVVQWLPGEKGEECWQRADTAPTVGDHFRQVIGYDAGQVD